MSEPTYQFFLAGIIQGSKQDLDVHDQSYRDAIRTAIVRAIPNSHIFCPVENHPESPSYNDEAAKEIFLTHMEKVKESHCLIVYLPEASMGSSIEMWEAYHHNIPVVTITPMVTNWVVRILSDKVVSDIQQFNQFVESGDLKELLSQRFSNS